MNIIGLEGDPSKRKIRSKYRTFCNLCRHRIEVGEDVWGWASHKFLVHLRCVDKEDDMSNYEFRQNVKVRRNKKKYRKMSQAKPAPTSGLRPRS